MAEVRRCPRALGGWCVHGLGVGVVVEPTDGSEEEGGLLGLAVGDEEEERGRAVRG